MTMTNYQEAAVLKHELGIEAMPFPTEAWIGLSTSTPAENGTGFVEPAGGAYARARIALATFWSPLVEGQPTLVSNAEALPFATATGAWGKLTHWGMFDAPTGGNLRRFAPLAVERSPQQGDTPSFAPGDLIMTLE